MARQKINPEDSYPPCERCGKKVPRLDPINVFRITAKAGYWRDMPNNIKICSECSSECSKELSLLIDRWWLELSISKYEKGVVI